MIEVVQITTAFSEAQFPHNFNIPEIPIVGRSNCGKSSLLNVLVKRRNLARCGKRPGVTISINFYKIKVQNTHFYLVDLPGYGFSKTDFDIKKNWEHLINRYFSRTRILKALFLMDIRRDIELDDEFILQNMLKNYEVIFILTKSDKISTSQIATKIKKIHNILSLLNVKPYAIIATSTKNNNGIYELRKLLFCKN